ncbi:MAG: ComEA family DNA-binding protein [Chloroflexi bacterium]|nr:ComEA family DNA-binding protein [Chloroflexota bacterium]
MSNARRTIPLIAATSAFWVLLFITYLIFGQRRPAPQAIEIIPVPTLSVVTPTAAHTPTPSPLRVYVSGAVNKPGVYRLPPDSLAEDAIAEAGGESIDADLVAINLAHPLADGEQIYVPTLGEAPPPPVISAEPSRSEAIVDKAGQTVESGEPIDLNKATLDQLVTLSGIGPKTAESIIAGRPYGTVDDLLRIKGIGEKTLEKLRPYIAVE